jgi:hypothetical protein
MAFSLASFFNSLTAMGAYNEVEGNVQLQIATDKKGSF